MDKAILACIVTAMLVTLDAPVFCAIIGFPVLFGWLFSRIPKTPPKQ